MKKVWNKYTIIGISCLGAFLLLMILLLTVDKVHNYVGAIGLYSFNKAFLVSYYNETWDVLSDVILYIALGFTVGLAIYGLYQLISKKSLFKVDKDIIFTGIGIVIIALLWIIFDKVFVVNYRPIVIDGLADESFPSTHVMITTFVLLISCRVILKRKPYSLKNTIAGYSGMSILVALCALGRLLSCMHWMTDVLGGLFIGFGLYFLVVGLDKAFESKQQIQVVEE
ncbi:MAG: phosphatase PAP2 family protein [Anaeroplasmataceae bacterium]|nr:phosphatase PAP2 family protein [Anaeroplasmataceae bacterium]